MLKVKSFQWLYLLTKKTDELNMKIKIVWIVALLLGVTSCYEDKGNYDYKDMNNIEISVSTESSSYALGDKVISKPELTFTFGRENSELAYEWTYDGHVVSRTKDLEWVADTVAKDKDLRLAVMDRATGVSYFGKTIISISTPYVKDGWIILSEKEGQSMLTFMRYKTEEGVLKPVVTRDIYQIINKESLGSQPISVYPHWVEPFDGEDRGISWLWVAQKGGQGTVDVSGSSYQREGVLSQMFLNAYPKDLVPQAVIDLQCLTMAIGENGAIYTRVKENNLLFNTSRFIDTPLTSDAEGKVKVDGSMIAYAPFADHGGLLLYDENSGQYLHVTDKLSSNGTFNSGKVLTLNVDESTYIDHPSYARLDHMKDYKVHYVGACRSSAYENSAMMYVALIENRTSKQFSIQKFKVKHFSGGSSVTKLATTYDSQKVRPELSEVIDGTSKQRFSLFRYQDYWEYLFISKGNDLYLYYLNGKDSENNLYKCATFPSPITSIDTEYYKNKYIIVGLESGDAFIMKGYTDDTSDENTIDKYVVNKKQTIQVTGVDGKFVLYHEKDLGRIVHARYKPDNGNGWNEFDSY